jgi:ATP-binding protein involved in chromosome partitioning
MIDSRIAAAEKRFRDVKRVIIVSGGKGGIGKSLTSSLLALILTELGYKTGLLDMDLCGPSDHLILGAQNVRPVEDKGMVPPLVSGIRFMSIVLYSFNRPAVFRKEDYANAVVELLAVTLWGELDFLIVDSPPGIENAFLDSIRLMKNPEFLLLATDSKIVLETVRKMLEILKDLKIRILGIIENLKIKGVHTAQTDLASYDVPFLGQLPVDPGIENCLGDIAKLRETEYYKTLKEIILSRVLSPTK